MVALAPSQRPLVAGTGLLSNLGGWTACWLAAVFYFSSVLVCNALQMLSLVVIPFSRKAFRSINRTIADTWWGWCVIGAERIFGVQPVFSGDDVPSGENALIFANHQQMPDILVIMMLAYRKKRLGDMKWFVKDPIKYVPGIGWGMQFLDCIFVKRDWLADKAKILSTFKLFFSAKIPIWLITFVEGTRITPAKLEKSQTYCKRKGMAHLKNVMYPRTRGFTAALEGLEGHIDAVYDVTIGYDGGVPTMAQIYRGLVKKVYIDVRRFPVSALPQTEASRAAWLQERFVRKDEALEHLFASGHFPD
jgi:1-acyl-sn-glycerol-3-phosphate acyltransferase